MEKVPPLEPERVRILRFFVCYDGARYAGYQCQPHALTVQGRLNEAWRLLSRGEEPAFHACSRLDAGVHAYKFILHLQTASLLEPEEVLRGMNGILADLGSPDIGVVSVDEAPAGFHARFHAQGKHYRYLLWHGRGNHPLLTRRAWRLRTRECPYERLPEALSHFVGKRDFAAFRAQDCAAKTTVREIRRIDCWEHPLFAEMRVVDVWGNGFLKNMIRNIVGSAIDAASGKLASALLVEAFAHGDRTRVGQCAPAHALTLMDVYYDDAEFQGAAARGARMLPPI